MVRYPRNLVELNTENLKPGVVIQSNVIAFNGTGGLQVNGIDLAANETQGDPVAYDRIVNNTIIGGSINRGAEAPPETIQGALFEQGRISFADQVTEYLPGLGGAAPTTLFQNDANILGAPTLPGRGGEPVDGLATVSLGLGGSITVQFTDNLLTGSGDSRGDLIVYETGEIESIRVEISRDGQLFQDVGILGGLTNQIDIDALGFGTQDRFAFVRLTDLRQGDADVASLGADIDAVGALSTVPVESFTAGGVGIELVGNASPALLNNIISNSETGVLLDPTNALPILGANTYYRNTANVPDGVDVGQFAQQLSDAEVIFVAASNLVFAPSAGASIIDSSIDSLEDRFSLTAVKNPLGLPPSPILAPRLDVNGQLRVDDPNVETPGGLGERVFKDRGASDRGDLVGPRVVLLSPLAENLGTSSGVVSVFGQAPPFFEVQLIDGLAPADVVPGTGIDDQSISNVSVLLLKDNVALVEGVDYRFGYNPSTNVIRLTPIAGVWEENSTYVIRMIDATDAIVAATEGNTYTDADILNLRDLQGNTLRFEYETGITLNINAGTLQGGTADGQTFDVFDGTRLITFEFDNDATPTFNPLNSRVVIPAAGNDALLATALADAVNAADLNLTAIANGLTVQFLGNNPLSFVTPSGFIRTQGAIGTSQGFGIQIPADLAGVSDVIEDGVTFVVRRGAIAETTFEFDNNGSLDTPGTVAITFNDNSSLDDIADEMVRRIGGVGLGLAPSNAGFGRVVLGGDPNYSVDLTGSGLTQFGFAGQQATVPVTVRIDQTATEVALAINNAISGANIAGVSSSIADTRIFLEGTEGVTGVGAVETITVQDEVGNELQNNQAGGQTRLTIFVGGGFDYGDAPAPYTSSDVAGGPRHAVDPTFAIGSIISADSDAKLPNGDDDDGISIGTVQVGFGSSVTVQITNGSGDPFFLDAWFDWNANGVFEESESLRFGSDDPTRPVVATGTNTILVNVPSTAIAGDSYARFRLSRQANLGATGDASVGEVQDVPLVIASNPFQNSKSDTVNSPAQDLRKDVNDSGVVTPLDALQIINAIGRSGDVNGKIPLDVFPLPPQLPPFPDVNGNGVVSALDALLVINQLARLPNTNGDTGEGEIIAGANAIGYAPVAGGVLASGATRIGDLLRGDVSTIPTEDSEAIVAPTSVFDSTESVRLDSIVDDLAEDTTSARESQQDKTSVLDRLFASI